ncbi:PaaI family thioesterase [Mameliella sediminis]|uniref:PaaI family thioesterase n=1 Tax=Mameliella sediminis TaxID=2836866 RepID=UPI001C43B0B5|nr:PaaI family thioesterase [Mameliella sediminis]MBV7394084.1 PaaI family thioesterase [Mameliella sediminis]
MTAITWDSQSVPLDLGGFNQMIGLKLVSWAPGRARLEMQVDERHLNSLGIMHGGVGASLLDTAMGMGVSYRGPDRPRGWCVTLSLNTQFIQPLRPGPVFAESRRIGGGKSVAFMEAELRDAEGALAMAGQGTFKLLDRPVSA